MLFGPDQQEKPRGNHYPAVDVPVSIKQDNTALSLVRVECADKGFRISCQIHGCPVYIQVGQIHVAVHRSEHLKGQCSSFLHQNPARHG